MAAIITTDLKKQIIQSIYDDVTDSNGRYFIGIGRSEDWDSADTPPVPVNTLRDIRNARLSLQSIKAAEDVSFVVPRVNWSSGTIYNAWNDNLVGYPSPSYYVLTSDNSVYICLRQARNTSGAAVPSTVQPTGSLLDAFTTADGYVWKFLFTLTSLNASRFLTANYLPVRLVGFTDSASPALDIEQKNVQVGAVPGQISSVRIVDNGANYLTAPSVTFRGNGTGAAATAIISGGQVVRIQMNNDSSAMGSGYTYAEAILTGGGFTTPAIAYPVLSPPAGFGADPRDDLRSTAIMFNSKPSGIEGGDFIIDNDFRQIVIIKNILKSNDSDFIAGTGNTLRTLQFADVNVGFSPDKIILGGTSGAKAIVDKYETGVTPKVYYHQNETTGFIPFVPNEVINETNGSGNGLLDSDLPSTLLAEANAFSGKILYIDNRAAVDRSADQTEDIKAIIAI